MDQGHVHRGLFKFLEVNTVSSFYCLISRGTMCWCSVAHATVVKLFFEKKKKNYGYGLVKWSRWFYLKILHHTTRSQLTESTLKNAKLQWVMEGNMGESLQWKIQIHCNQLVLPGLSLHSLSYTILSSEGVLYCRMCASGHTRRLVSWPFAGRGTATGFPQEEVRTQLVSYSVQRKNTHAAVCTCVHLSVFTDHCGTFTASSDTTVQIQLW